MPFYILEDAPKPEVVLTPDELKDYLVGLAREVNSAEEPYSAVCDGCVEVMLRARRTFTDVAQYGISGAQAAMIGQEVSRRLS